MSVKQLSVFLENRPGALYGMTGILSQNKIDMRALSVAETRDFGILRIIVDDPYKTATVLKDAGYVYNITPVLGVAIPDVPGGLNKVLQVLTDARINVEYMYAFLGGKTEAAYMIFRVEDNNAAAEALASRGIKTLEEAGVLESGYSYAAQERQRVNEGQLTQIEALTQYAGTIQAPIAKQEASKLLTELYNQQYELERDIAAMQQAGAGDSIGDNLALKTSPLQNAQEELEAVKAAIA